MIFSERDRLISCFAFNQCTLYDALDCNQWSFFGT